MEYAPAEMKNGAEVMHFATGLVVGYPSCPGLDALADFIHAKYGLAVVVGTHPIPQKYYLTLQQLETWKSSRRLGRLQHVLTNEAKTPEV